MKGVFVSYSYYGTLHLSENGMFAFRANLTAGLCPLLALGGVLISPELSEDFAGKIYTVIMVILLLSVYY